MTRQEAKSHVGKGWHTLIDKAYDLTPLSVFISDVKEKFGGLRIEIVQSDLKTLDAIEHIEEESLTICELCGAPGQQYTNHSGWITTRCEKHR